MTLHDLVAQAHSMISFLHPTARADHLIEIAARRCVGDRDRWHSRWLSLADVAAEYAIDQALRGYDIYVGVNPRWRMRSGRGGHNQDVAAVTTLPLDFDRRHEQDPRPAFAFLTAAGIPPSVINESGDGSHFHLRLAEELPVDLGRALAQRLHLACGGDAVHDPRRVMRVPGSFNYKRQARCHIIELHQDRIYTASQITAALDATGVPAVEVEPSVRPAQPVDAPADINALFGRLRPDTLRAIQFGVGPIIDEVIHRTDGGDHTFSAVDYRVISRIIREADATDGQIESIYNSFPIGALSARRKPRRYLTHTIERVRSDIARRRSRRRPGIGGQSAPVVEDKNSHLVETIQRRDGLWVIPPVDLDALDDAVFGPMPPLPPEFMFTSRTNAGVQ